jgi:hypothetical protein
LTSKEPWFIVSFVWCTMSSTYYWEQIKWLKGSRRRKAVAAYLVDLGAGRWCSDETFVLSVAHRAGVTNTMVSKVLHGRAVSAPVGRAIAAEENERRGKRSRAAGELAGAGK